MHHIKLAVLVIVALIITGCQQTYNQKSITPVPGDGSVVSSRTFDSTDKSYPSNDCEDVILSRKSPVDSTSQTRRIPSDYVLNPDTAQTGALGPQPEIPESVYNEQVKIDQSLELCNLAQEMWEAGRLEDALSYLDDAYSTMLEIDTDLSMDINQQRDDIRFLISKRILEIYASRQVAVAGSHDEIPITLNEHVQYEIKRLTGPEKQFLINSLKRAGRFRPYILSQLKAAGLPEELSWLPLIESGYQLRALSSARALGLWQFIPSTGHKFGLTRNRYIDERMDPEKSTQAAIAYLKELHNLFGDWTTVLAAYNCGEGRVLRTIRNQRLNYLDNFWDLYQNLPRETARYVPRFLATLHIMQNLDSYGITVDNPLQPLSYKSFEVQKQMRLTDIAKEISVSADDLKTLNPELRDDILPPETYRLKIPANKSELFLARVNKIQAAYSAPQLTGSGYHKIRRGETLSSIASRYGTTVNIIARANNIYRTHRIIAGTTIKVPTTHNTASNSSAAAKKQAPVRYKVQKGDSLWVLAKKFSTTTKEIMGANNLSNAMLHVGQVLTITPSRKSTTSSSYYYVKSGDSPFLIAKKHNMSLNRLLALNRLSKTCKIFPGQKLIVE
ncbi:lytic transglycosylase [Desulfotignum phosphitoxidans]|uniref:Membrane-bound lytic murein transglycosylase D n=1 Tax=Desulfotignum phosphitoxidans DSM 13687 TaxID=1286635 RepID=S0G7F7_9BACT|nr:LysM peptidoglycan-binding domain-containing protein [Desulfotignum phosphitoxidans]EMS81112.1 membrane-bound lytic murein transglycosylase D [Desulfotignum phosphitoxidans DSM 13687]